MNDVEKRPSAVILGGKDFILVHTLSGYRSMRWDPLGKKILLHGGAEDHLIGEALLRALDARRLVLAAPRHDVWIHPDVTFDKDLYDLKLNGQYYEACIDDVVRQLGYKNKRALFKSISSCHAERIREQIVVSPSVQEKLDAWAALPEDQNVVLSATSTPTEIGAGVRLAISRCS